MGKKVEKIYDNLTLFHEIYRMRGLTVNQLSEVMFNTKAYAYKYLQRLKEDGWLHEKTAKMGKYKRTKVYFCSDKAIETLEKENLIEKVLKAKDNTPPTNKLWYYILTNEVYAELTPIGIQVYDSREWKRKNGMDNNSLVRAGMQMVDGKEYGLYLFFSPDLISGAGLSDSMLKKFKSEIKKFPQTSRFAVLCYDSSIYEKVVKAVDGDPKTLAHEELQIIPMGMNGFGYNLLKISRSQLERKNDLENILNARLNENHPALEGNKQNFTRYVAEYEEHETYVVDFLSMNRPVLHHLSTHYYHEIYKKDGRQVDLVCWKPNEKELANRFKQYPHVNIVPIPIQDLTASMIPKLTKVKLQ